MNKLHRESAKTTRKREAEKLLRKREREVASGEVAGDYVSTTYNHLRKKYLENFKRKGYKSLEQTMAVIKHLDNFFNDIQVYKIDTDKVVQYTLDRQKSKNRPSDATINKELAILGSMFTISIELDLIPNKQPNWKFIRLDEVIREGFIEKWEYEKLYKELPLYLKRVFKFAYHTGWRKSEIFSLTWDRVLPKEGKVKLTWSKTKTGQFRELKVDREIKELILELWNEKESDNNCNKTYVFLNAKRTGRIVNMYTAWRNACERAGVGKKLLHDCRRVAVTHMIDAGCSEKVAMMISGHKTDAMIRRYNIVGEKTIEEAMARTLEYVNGIEHMGID